MKKIIGFITCICMIFSSVCVFGESTASVGASQLYDEQSAAFYSELFSSLGFTGEYQEPDSGMSRMDFLILLAQVFGIDMNSISEDEVLSYAEAKGIIADKDNFDGEDGVTYEQAVKMSVVVAGFEYEAAMNGSYPTGYLIVASRMDYDDGVYIPENSSKLCTGQALNLLGNVAQSEFLRYYSFGEEFEFIRAKDQTPLSVFYDLYEIEGIVSANGYSSIYSPSEALAGEDNLLINDEIYFYSGEVSLGENIRAFVKNNGNKKTIVALEGTENEYLKVKSDEIISVDNSSVTYEADGKEKKAKLRYPCYCIYNGKAFGEYTLQDLKIKNGYLYMTDNDSDGTYDVVHIYEAEFMSVAMVNSADKKVFDVKKSTMISGEENDTVIKVYSGDEEVGFEGIKTGDVLEVYSSKDSEFIRIDISSQTVRGKLSELGDNAYVGDTEYELTGYFKEYFLPLVEVGKEYTFALSTDGKIVAFSGASTGMKYAILCDAAMNGKGLDKKVQIKIFDSDGTLRVVDIPKDIRVNGEKISDEAFLAKVDSVKPGNETVIKINFNAVMEPVEILLPQSEYGYISDDMKDKILVPLDATAKGSSLWYRGTGKFGQVFYRDDTTTVFSMSDDVSLDDADRYSTTLEIKLSGIQISSSKFMVYNVSENMRADCIVYKTSEGAGELSDEASRGVVSEVRQAVNPLTGDDGIKLVVCSGGYYHDYFITDTGVLESIPKASAEDPYPVMPGDFIRYNVNAYGVISRIVKDFEYKTKKVINNGDEERTVHYFYGKAYANNSKFTTVSVYDEEANYDFGNASGRNICQTPKTFMVFDSKQMKITDPAFSYTSLQTYENSQELADEILISTIETNSPVGIIYR